MWPFTVRDIAKELQDANVRLDQQARQLRTAHSISQVIHGSLDLRATLQAITKALVEVADLAAAQLTIDAKIDGAHILESIADGDPGDRPSVTLPLVTRGEEIGATRLWAKNDEQHRDLLEMTEYVIPTIYMAIDDALAYGSVVRYRNSLEAMVHERTAQLAQARDELAHTVADLRLAQETRDRIFANINHEIRTPLSLITLSTAEIRRRAQGHLDEGSSARLDDIDHGVQRLLYLVDGLLLLAAGQEGKLQPKLQSCDVATLLKGVVSAWKPAAAEARLVLAYDGPEHLSAVVDAAMVERVVQNLVSNALKFTPQGSVQVLLRGGREGVTIAVRDTGIGIDPEFRTRIFGRFEQGRAPVRAGGRGSGIGLSIVKELVEAHGGRIDVLSPSGGGTVFEAHLPTREATGEGPPASATVVTLEPRGAPRQRHGAAEHSILHPPQPAEATVLVAEDDLDLLDGLTNVLLERYRVIRATDGLTALHLAQEHRPDLLISDVGMPGMDGLELTRAFRNIDGNRLAPVILLTAFADMHSRLSGFQAGAVDYLVKPFEPRELLARVSSQLALRGLALKLSSSEKLASLGVLSSGLAHEMRNPANGLVNAIAPLKALLPKDLLVGEHPVAQLIEVIETCGNQVARLSKQLLGFRRAGQLEYLQTSWHTLWMRAQAVAEPYLKGLTLRYTDEFKGDFWCAESMLIQVLTNLLENAAHAAGQGGWISVRAAREDEDIVIDVGDSGPGVPVELRERVFEPFFTTKPPGQGTGLGLTTCRDIVGQHLGTLDIADVQGGTIFRMRIPIDGRARQRAQSQQSNAPASRRAYS